jgi:predicted dehydrogenase/threonine dehydrogenase-like Zn-dependent dehydrogenase
MKQLLQRFDTGELRIASVPTPRASGVQLLVESRASVISAGTERMLVQFGRSNVLEKARQQPEKVRQVLEKVRTDGLAPTLEAVRSKLADPIALGYCNAGVVVEAGPGVTGFRVGDRVVTNGPHADYVRVPHTLAARIPTSVDFEQAAFVPLGAIALQGIRLAEPTLGETVVVYGLGLIGQLSVQLLRANGCRVIAVDRSSERLRLAEAAGAIIVDGADGRTVEHVMSETGGRGADAVLLTLASSSDEPVHEAAAMSRRRGRIVLVGVTGLQLRRDDFYRKELSFAVSCSYGPGRYDPAYEEQGQDYPVGFVRWTEQRNFEAVLQLMADRRVATEPLVSHRFEFENAEAAYDVVTRGDGLGIVLNYADRGGAVVADSDRIITVRRAPPTSAASARVLCAGVIGAGAYSQRILLPAARRAGFVFRSFVSGGGTSAAIAAEKFDARVAATEPAAVLDDGSIGSVFVLTRHDSHARYALAALQAGKHVFVEKPLALTLDDLAALRKVAADSPGILTVGFNRRFAPLTRQLVRALAGRAGPASVIVTVNAGSVPRDHWTQDRMAGGRRIAGEACHFVDLTRHIIGHAIAGASVSVARGRDGSAIDDIAHVTLNFEDGSTAAIHYLANGASSYPKERVEVFADSRTWVIDNWRRMRAYGAASALARPFAGQDKGHRAELLAWADAVKTGQPPIAYDELFEVSAWSLRLAAEVSG